MQRNAFKGFWNSKFWNFSEKTAFDWLEIAVIPFMIALVGFAYSDAQNKANNKKQELDKRNAQESRQHEIMTNYLSQMTNLLLKQKLRESSEDSEVRIVARALTLNAARRLENENKGYLLKFLYEAKLIGTCPDKGPEEVSKADCKPSVFDLDTVRLEKATLSDSPMPTLSGINLRRAVLNKASLPSISLPNGDLQQAQLKEATLTNAFLKDANLQGANLKGADLEQAILSKANLIGALMKGAHLKGASLDGANLEGTVLTQADLSNTDLSKARLGRNGAKENPRLNDTNLQGAILFDVDLSSVKLEKAKLNGAFYNAETKIAQKFKEVMRLCPTGEPKGLTLPQKLKRLNEVCAQSPSQSLL